ncbi:MAG: 50S ribosomal protein L32 [Patescibacteria group bacterium]
MPHQGHRRTSTSKKTRAAHFAIKKTVLTSCQKCKEPVKPHHACGNCGSYKGEQVVDKTRSTRRLMKKAQEKAQAEKENTANTKET